MTRGRVPQDCAERGLSPQSSAAYGRRVKVRVQIADVLAHGAELADWQAGCIVISDGCLSYIERRRFGYRPSRLRVWWDTRYRPQTIGVCRIYFSRHRSNPNFLVLGYVMSGRLAGLSSLYVGQLVLDEIARLQGCRAIVAELTNARLSDRLLHRWGWERHCLNWRGRHFIKRFYQGYSVLPPIWLNRIAKNTDGSLH